MIKSFNFSGGEVQAEVDIDGIIRRQLFHRIQSSDDFMALIMATEVLKRATPFGTNRTLIVPYFPYARQDRVTNPRAAFSLKMAAKLINDLGYDAVVSCDVHSDVTPALVDRMRVVTQAEIITKYFPALDEFIKTKVTCIIAPDAGAAKKAELIARFYDLPLIQASKIRDTSTGEITGTEIHGGVENDTCLIVDDICDGGRTFTELAYVLKQNGADAVHLYVTHGIFSKGYDVFTDLIDSIYTTDSFVPKEYPINDRVPLTVSQLKYGEI